MGEQIRVPKSAFRRRLQGDRRNGPAVLTEDSRAIAAWVLQLTAFRLARNVVAYAPLRDEPDLGDVVEVALADHKTVYFPRVVESGLEFLETPPTTLRPGAHGVLEPRHGRPLDPGASGILFLVPGLAFTPSGLRLGRGGGHYDRALSTRPQGVRVGLSTEARLLTELPCDPWDQAMDLVATERRLLVCSRRFGGVSKENPA